MSRKSKYVIREFPEELIGRIVWDDAEGYTVVRDTIDHTGRWHVGHEIVFREESTGKLYRTYQRRAATENQDNEDPEPECVEVVAVQKTVTDYEALTVDG